MRLLNFPQLTLLLITFAFLVNAKAQTKWDVVEIFPGMSPAEAETQAQKNWPGIRLKPLKRGLTYSDGLQLHETEAATVLMTGTSPALPKESVGMTFTPGLETPKLVAVTRKVQPKNPPTVEQLESALIEKYGQPYHRTESPGRGGSVAPSVRLFWAEPGKPRCDSNGYNNEPQAINSSFAIEALISFRNLQKRGLAPTNLRDCSTQVVAYLRGNPVTMLDVQLTDTGMWLSGLEQAESLIKELGEKATSERAQSAENPKL